MLPRNACLSVALVLAASTFVVACAPPAVEEVDGQGAAVTGSDDTDGDSPLVYVFSEKDAKDDKATPVCVGVKIGDKSVLTVKGCGADGAVVRQASKDGATKPIAVTKVQSPPTPSSTSTTATRSDLRVLELASSITGPDVKVGPLTLSDGYTVLGADTLNPDEKEAVEVKARIESQTGSLGKLVLKGKDQQLCASDLGAPVFAKHPTRLFGFLWKTGDWVLSGMVSGVAPADKTTAPATALPDSKGCSAGPWTAAALSTETEWLAKFQPAPKTTPDSSGSSSPSGPKTTAKAAVQACAIVTKTLPEVKTGTRTAAIEAKAIYTNLSAGQARAQIGIAPKASPTSMTWTPATFAESTGTRVELAIKGGIDAPTAEGDYVVLFRASADNGLTWTECDLDSSENGSSVAQALALHVGAAAPATTEPAPASDYSAPTSSDSSDDSDDSSSSKGSKGDDSEETAAPGKKAAAGGCSVSQPSNVSASGFSTAGLLLGLAALVRRRKAR